MFLAYAILFLVVLAWILRRDLSAIGQIKFKGGLLLGGLVVALFILQATTVLYVSGQTALQILVLVSSQLALILLLGLNRHLPGVKLFILGIALNLLVMIANGGWMPVSPETYRYIYPNRVVDIHSRPPSSKNIILQREETSLWVLSDIIRLTLPWRRTAISVGDVLLVVAAAQFIFQSTSTKAQGYTNEENINCRRSTRDPGVG